MPRPSTEAYQDGDRIEDGAGSVGFVRQCKGSKGPYLRVKVIDGPRAGEWVWPERFGPPQLDWTTDGLREVCGECGRDFRGGFDACGGRRVFCRTCDRILAKQDRRQAAEASPSHAFGARRARVYRR